MNKQEPKTHKTRWTLDNLARAGVLLLILLFAANQLFGELFNNFFSNFYIYAVIPFCAAIFGTVLCGLLAFGAIWLLIGNQKMTVFLDSSRGFKAFMAFNTTVGTAVVVWLYYFTPYGMSSL
jgi:hypothetical protein